VQGEWSFLTEFAYIQPSAPATWDDAIAFGKALAALEAPDREQLRVALEHWNTVLSDLGGDPLRENWARFRPLRLRREEDWSDWLVWFVENSASGRLAAKLFGRKANTCCTPAVERELTIERNRHDVQICWLNGDITTVEVKVGDQDFEKTGPAVEIHSRSNPGTRCDYWILLPPRDLDRCDVSAVRKIGWDYVAKCLRTCIRYNDELLTWRVWGRAFVGCIEQDLLGFPRIDDVNRVQHISELLQHLEDKNGK
jgi:hypothetical protein